MGVPPEKYCNFAIIAPCDWEEPLVTLQIWRKWGGEDKIASGPSVGYQHTGLNRLGGERRQMQQADLLKRLDYDSSPNFLRAGQEELEAALAYGHIFRLAVRERRLKGVYALRPPGSSGAMPIVPVVYICDAGSDEEADLTHRLVWNQDVVPFLIVETPRSIRLYSGFRHQRRKDGSIDGLLRVLHTMEEVTALVDDFRAESIDSGALWRTWGKEVQPEGRVDWRLLDNLKALDRWLQKEGGLQDRLSHALIGKYVYLRYLRDRDILSDRKLQSWDLAKEQVFGRDATLPAFRELISRLDRWLNGAVFPIDFEAAHSIKQDHLRRVAATFEGDALGEDGSWQLHLDFKAYDFSYIPIETLSVVYEQFLHTTVGAENTKGKDAGAYYTPIPVVNFMLAEMSERVPLRSSMKVLDPSCGSGTFLVQCYRRLIEAAFPPNRNRKPNPIELRYILERSIFGIDRDADACGVTELSLIVTLLDYVDPPDLENDRRIKLPSLRNRNIFHADFFASGSQWRRLLGGSKFDWVVGNPPWKKLLPAKLSNDDRAAWIWMAKQKERNTPVGNYQMAQAFVWEAGELVAEHGEIAFLLPAMTLFEDPSQPFRAAFFRKFQVFAVANFSNLAEVLFAGRSRVPAAAFFFCKRQAAVSTESLDREYIRTYSPLVANQEPTRPVVERRRNETWSLVLNASEVRDIPLARVVNGAGRPWKLAAWGSHLDEKLLDRLRCRFLSIRDLEKDKRLIVSQGLELRPLPNPLDKNAEAVDYVPEVVGKSKLNPSALKKLRNIFAFPANALEIVGPEFSYVRKRGGILPLSVCRPPHVIVGAARHYAVYTDEYLVIPPRQIGLISTEGNEDLLKAISLFLSSDFAFYHQFFTSTQFGVKRDVATLDALREIPLPLATLSNQQLKPWVALQSRLVEATRNLLKDTEGLLFDQREDAELWVETLPSLLKELNQLVADALGLSDREQALIGDLVHVRLELNDGKLGHPAVIPPNEGQMRHYAERLKGELDAFIEGELSQRHQIIVVYDRMSAMIKISLAGCTKAGNVPVVRANAKEAAALERTRARLRRQWSQWVYFDRDLRVFEGTQTYLFKPMQLFHWTESQAMFDAAEILAEALGSN
jgi:hypothetical protein